MKKTIPVTPATGNPNTPKQLEEALRELSNLLTPPNMPGASMMATMPLYGKAKPTINHELKRKQYGIYNGHSEWDLARAWFQTSNDHFFDTYGFNFVPRGRLFDEAKKSLM